MAHSDKFTRLLSLVALLEFTNRPLTQREIVERLPDDYRGEPKSVRRKFERDKVDLRAIGVPLRTEVVPGTDPPLEGYRVVHDRTVMRRSDFEPAELAALQSAVAALALQRTDPSEVLDPEGGLRKLGGIGRHRAQPAEADLAVDVNLAAAFEAILGRRPLAFTYHSRLRRVVPRCIMQLDGYWYLDAIDQDLRAGRNFRFDRIEGSVLAVPDEVEWDDPDDDGPAGASSGDGGPPVVPAPPPLTTFRPWEFGDGDATPVRIRLDPPVAPAALAADPELRVVVRDDDGVEVELDVRDEDALFTWLVGFLDHAEVLAPPGVRAGVVGRLAALAGEG